MATETKQRLVVTKADGTKLGYVKFFEFGNRYNGNCPHATYTNDVADAKLFGERSANRAKTGLYLRGGHRVEMEAVTVIVDEAPKASAQMLNATKQVFESILKQMKDNARVMVRSHYEAIKATAAKTTNHETLKAAFGRDVHGYIKATKMVEKIDSNNYRINAPHALKSNVDSLITKWVEEDVTAMFEQFIAKQTNKVAAVVKNNTVEVSASVRGNLEGEFRFKLGNGSKFTMRTQIVWKTSINGLVFWQFPTTFHDVVKADGSAMKTPPGDGIQVGFSQSSKHFLHGSHLRKGDTVNYLIQTREYAGTYSNPFRRRAANIKYTTWRTVDKATTLEEAKQKWLALKVGGLAQKRAALAGKSAITPEGNVYEQREISAGPTTTRKELAWFFKESI